MVNNSTYTNKKKNHLLTSNHVSQENTTKYNVGNQSPGLWQAQQCGECKTIKEILTPPPPSLDYVFYYSSTDINKR